MTSATPKRHFDLAVFDSDGTLTDSIGWMSEAVNDLADKHGFRKMSREEQLKHRDVHGKELLAALNIPLWKLPLIMRDMRAVMAANIERFQLFEGIPQMLQGLADSGVTIGIVSSNAEENIRVILGRNQAVVKHYACGASFFGKTTKLKKLLKAAKVLPARAIYIGDEIRDGEAAHAVGVKFGAVTWGQHSAEALKKTKPEMIFNQVEEITKQILREKQ